MPVTLKLTLGEGWRSKGEWRWERIGEPDKEAPQGNFADGFCDRFLRMVQGQRPGDAQEHLLAIVYTEFDEAATLAMDPNSAPDPAASFIRMTLRGLKSFGKAADSYLERNGCMSFCTDGFRRLELDPYAQLWLRLEYQMPDGSTVAA